MATNGKTGVAPSIAESKILSQTIQSDLQKLLQQYQCRENEHAAKVSKFENGRQNMLNEAKKKAEVIVTTAKTEAEILIKNAELQAQQTIEAAAKKNEDVEKEKAAWEQEKLSMASTQHFQQQINLDIGGTKLATSIVTLCRFPDTMIGVMFSGRHELPLNADGYHFVDRDGTHFRHILNFLRNPEGYEVKLSPENMRELKLEAQYYGLEDLMFPFTPAAPVTVEDDFTGCSDITITQRQDGLWLMSDPSYFTTPTAVICCQVCKAGFVVSRNRCNLGVRDFLAGREIVNDTQPLTTASQPHGTSQSASRTRCIACRK